MNVIGAPGLSALPAAPRRSPALELTQEETVAKEARPERIDPSWPDLPDGEHPVSELASPRQGSLSPFGDVEFPLPDVPYEHPVTEINR